MDMYICTYVRVKVPLFLFNASTPYNLSLVICDGHHEDLRKEEEEEQGGSEPASQHDMVSSFS